MTQPTERIIGRITQDDMAESPRDWDNMGTMVCWHDRYQLGDDHNHIDDSEWRTDLACDLDPTLIGRLERADERIESGQWSLTPPQLSDAVLDKHTVMLPLYLYDHGGITMSTGPFGCTWDSGQVGWIYVTVEQTKKEHGWKRMTAARVKQVEDWLRAEVDVYDQFLRGDVYGFEVVRQRLNADDEWVDWEDLDSCWGFYGDDPQTNGMLDHISDDNMPTEWVRV